MPLGKLVTPQLGTGTGAGAGAGVGSTCSSAVNEPNIAVRERSDEKTAATERATYSEAVPFERIAAQHIPSIESICKLTAAAIYNPSDASADEAVRRVAAHEVGHALVSLALTGRTDIMTITIEQEGTGTLGYVQHERNANPLPTADDLESRLATLMGGMAAEELEFGGYSCGNSSDLAQATGIARAYTATYGMSSAGFVQFASPTNASGGRLEDLPVAVLDKMNELMASSFERAKRTIEANRPAFTLMTEAIIEEKTMKGGELVSLWHQATGGAENNAGAPAGNATGGSAGGNVGARTGDAGTAAGGAVAGNAMPAAAM